MYPSKGTRLHADLILIRLMDLLGNMGIFSDEMQLRFTTAKHVTGARNWTQIVPVEAAGRMNAQVQRAVYSYSCNDTPATALCSEVHLPYEKNKVMFWEFYNQIIDEAAADGPILFQFDTRFSLVQGFEWIVNITDHTKPNYQDGHLWTWEPYFSMNEDEWKQKEGIRRYTPKQNLFLNFFFN